MILIKTATMIWIKIALLVFSVLLLILIMYLIIKSIYSDYKTKKNLHEISRKSMYIDEIGYDWDLKYEEDRRKGIF